MQAPGLMPRGQHCVVGPASSLAGRASVEDPPLHPCFTPRFPGPELMSSPVIILRASPTSSHFLEALLAPPPHPQATGWIWPRSALPWAALRQVLTVLSSSSFSPTATCTCTCSGQTTPTCRALCTPRRPRPASSWEQVGPSQRHEGSSDLEGDTCWPRAWSWGCELRAMPAPGSSAPRKQGG